jgi:hypothetical protein
MKNKKVSVVMVVTMLCVCFVATSAWAGPEQRYRWEGVAIGVGAAILGNALFNACYSSPTPVYYSPAPVYCGPPLVYYRSGPFYSGPAVVLPYRGYRPHHRTPHRYR